MTNLGTLGTGALGLGAITALMTPSVTKYQAPIPEVALVEAPKPVATPLPLKPQTLKKVTSTLADLTVDNKSVNVDLKDTPYVPVNWVKALIDQESTNGQNKSNEKADQGKYGYIVGFTKDTYNSIAKMAKTSERYANLINKLDFDSSEESAIKSAAIYANHLMRDFGEEGNLKDGTTPKDIDLVELYRRYNGGASPEGIKLFEQKLQALSQ